MKIINVLGIELDNESVRESMLRTEEFFEDISMNTIYVVSLSGLVAAEEDSQLKEYIEQMDMRIIGDKEILVAAGNENIQRMNEVVSSEFLTHFIRQAVHDKKSLFLLCETEEELEKIQNKLLEDYPMISIVGTFAQQNSVGDADQIINNVNITSPDLLIVKMQTPNLEKFMVESRGKCNAKVCLGMSQDTKFLLKESKWKAWIKKIIHKGVFHRTVSKYNNEKR